MYKRILKPKGFEINTTLNNMEKEGWELIFVTDTELYFRKNGNN